ncbi:oxygenase MpaB family protein [[Mycobacterium] kokjensenii]|uniref:Oxygenase MpaB family protein n=1 Tax=[Mycobacterium] kokjensenii TaxID=3064287 RepID=A0ABM9LEF1_9MYCO|nr:oxygenase MpaB family protein [Mycolicibacter sp. MU0083]CAJ1497545.1 oxygenase MpaB family protein [Mycolicibacter sp. MU0083]
MTVTPTASVEQAPASPEHDTAAPAPKPATAVKPLNSDSLTWKYFGDLRTGIMGIWIGAIENMYPGLGAGVTEHSTILSEPMQRVTRSVYPIMGVVYDGAMAQHTGAAIRDYHRDIKGVDDQGRRYHALDPDTFYWAHATFFMMIIKLGEYFCGGLTLAEKRQLFDEHVQWYQMYGMSMRPVPKSWEDFCEYWDRVCEDELELTQAAVDILNIRIPKPWFVPIPTSVWDQIFRPALAAQRWVAAGLFEPVVREKAGLRWSDGDEVLFRLIGKVAHMAFTFVPDEIRLHPRALAGYRREQGKIAKDAPPIEAPWFSSPPKERRSSGMHYVPPVSPAMKLVERAGELMHNTFSLAAGGGLAPRPRPSRPRPKVA